MLRYVRAGTLLAQELFTKPSWAAHHVWGLIDGRLLLRFHQARMAELTGSATLGSGWQALSWSTGVDEHTARALWREAGERARRGSGGPASSIPTNNDGSDELVHFVYAVTRALRPNRVLEVGVGRGATSRAILAALEANGSGQLWSIEFPPLRVGYAQAVGGLVEEGLKSRWTLVYAPSAEAIPRLVASVGPPDLFVHDGAHSYYTQKADLGAVAGLLTAGAVMVVDDVNNDAFLETVEANRLEWASLLQRKEHVLGFARRDGAARPR